MASQKPVVLITGAEGRIGSVIAAALKDSYTVVGFERKCRGDNCINVDITSDEALARGCEELRARYGQRIASVIHLAAFYDFSGEPHPMYDEVNVKGTRRLLHALQSFDVEQFIYASTMLVHAPTEPGQPINEDSPLKPAWPYPQSKLDAERMVAGERGEIPALIMRIVGVYTDQCEVPSLANQIQRTLQFMKARRRQGRPLWFLLLRGDTIAGGSADYSDNFEASPREVLREMFVTGISVPWTLFVSMLIGIALMCTRLLFDTQGLAAHNDHVVGALVVTFTIMARSELARPLRFINIAFGLWLLPSPWLFGGYSGVAAAASVFFGLMLIWLAIPLGRVASHFGAWDRIARWRAPAHLPRHARA